MGSRQRDSQNIDFRQACVLSIHYTINQNIAKMQNTFKLPDHAGLIRMYKQP
jgi:hypothetical protein